MTPNVPERWWTELYDELMAEMILVRRDPAHTRQTIDFLMACLQLAPGARVFDQCCGIGSLAVPLAQRGFEVVAVDLMPDYLERARRRAAAASVPLALHLADAVRFVPRRPVEGALNWNTSFGYFARDDDNLGMLRCGYAALVSGGHYALDFMNVPQVLAEFRPRVVTPRETVYGRVVLTRDSAVEPDQRAMRKTWSYALPDGAERVYRSRVRLYRPEQLRALFEAAGFVDITCFGDVDGRPLSDLSPRCVVVGRKP